jgi:hypothetical protein
VPNECNVYKPGDFSATKAQFGCEPNDLDRAWCPAKRKTAQTVANGGPPDYIGVYVEAIHIYFTRFFGDSVTLTDQAIIQIEPRQL